MESSDNDDAGGSFSLELAGSNGEVMWNEGRNITCEQVTLISARTLLTCAEINVSKITARRVLQYWLDKSTIHTGPRWLAFLVLLFAFSLRIYAIQGYFIVAYGLGIFLLNNFIAFLSPLDDVLDSGPGLPKTEQEGKEYRPFARRLPEFKFWLTCSRGVFTCIFMTFFSMFDIPVFWPILLLYFCVLFFITMKRQILHMYKHKYVPLSWGKAKYKHSGIEQGRYGGGMAGASRGRSEWGQLKIY